VILLVGVSEGRVCDDPRAVLVTHSLGSCIGVALYDPAARVGGLLHFQLPSSHLDPAKANARPMMFADTGLAWLLQLMEQRGAKRRRMAVGLVGAARILNLPDRFDIGRHNHQAIRKALLDNGLSVQRELIGGGVPRSMYLNVGDGRLRVRLAA